MLLFEDIIEQYEAAIADRGWSAVDLREFIPHTDSQHHWSTLVELLRVRMEHQIAGGDFQGLQRCVTEYPALRSQAESLSLLAFEEYRLLSSAGVSISPHEYEKRWQVDVAKWDFEGNEYHLTEDDWRQAIEREATSGRFSAGNDIVRSSSTPSNPRLIPRRRAVLERGQVFGPFRILAEIGSGALATVYLAEQLDLSERLVVLKVCSIATGEPQRIAQLQHPNIVQILSLHDVAGYQVICMPYVGATTFADILAMQSGKVAKPTTSANKSQSHSTASAGGKVTKPTTSARTSFELSTTISMRQREVQTLIEDIAADVGKAPQIPQLSNSPSLARWKKLPFEQAVSELLYQAASGLEHAHQNGLVHSDLKPANILLGDDGKARLVDFNVAQQTIATAHVNTVGGTLPYMAPEHLQSLMKNAWNAGPASDIYSLGVVAHQLLSGQLPFETTSGPLSYVIEQALQQREQIRPTLSAAQASDDLRSIIEKMIEPELSRRYQSASALCEDLQRHLEHRPLKWAANRSVVQRLQKWTLRHPKLSSATTVGTLAAIVVFALAITFWSLQSSLRARLASKQVAEFHAALPGVFENAAVRWAFPELAEPLDEQLDGLVELLGDGKRALSDGAWQYVTAGERNRLAADLIKLKNVVEQEATIAPLSHQLLVNFNSSEDAQRLAKLAHDIDGSVGTHPVPESPMAQLAEAILAFNSGHTDDAIEALKRSLVEDSKLPTAWLLLGYCYVKNGNLTLADQAYASSLALAPNQWRVWFCRGLVKLDGAKLSNRRDEFLEAAEYFTRTLELKPNLAEASYNRAICREHIGDTLAALEDAKRAAQVERISIPANLFCARQYLKLGQKDASAAALKMALETPPKTAYDFIEMGLSRMASDPKQAIEDLLKANSLRPETLLVLQNLAYLTMEVVPDPKVADQVLNEWVAAAPSNAVAIASRAVHHARQSRFELALDDALQATNLTPTARETAQIASVYALVARANANAQDAKRCRDQAFTLLANALQQDWKLVAEISRDPDLLTLGDDTRFKLILGTAASLMQLPKLAQETKAISE